MRIVLLLCAVLLAVWLGYRIGEKEHPTQIKMMVFKMDGDYSKLMVTSYWVPEASPIILDQITSTPCVATEAIMQAYDAAVRRVR